MTIATFNVNSVNARAEILKDWLKLNDIDVVCLQELKCQNEKFPNEIFVEYENIINGQKQFNGVSTSSKFPIEKSSIEFTGQKTQSRFAYTKINDIHIINIYAPLGDLYEEKHIYKLEFYDELIKFLSKFDMKKDNVIVLGDFNIAHKNIDVHSPKEFEGRVVFLPEEREIMDKLLSMGLNDTFRKLYPDTQTFSWFGYQGMAVYKNEGLRLDYILCSDALFPKVQDIYIDVKMRRKRKPTPSDHCVVVVEVDV